MDVQKQALNLSWFIILGLIGYGIYAAGVRINYYADDFHWYFDPPPSNIFHYFWHKNPYEHQAYRPLQASFYILVQRFWGLDTLPIHLTQITLHVLLSWLIWRWMVNYGFTFLQAVLGSLFMLISQANAMAVLSVDTISQVSSPLFGCVSLWLLHYSHGVIEDSDKHPQGVTNRRYYIFSILTFALALLSKETSIAFFGMALCIILYKNAKTKYWSSYIRQSIVEIIPYLVILALYFGIRSILGLGGPTLSSSRYGLHFGLNTVQNICMFVFQAFLPVSSVDAFIAFKNRELSILSVIIASWSVVVSAVVYGVMHTKRHHFLALLSICAIIGLFPAMLMNHISELYLYSSMPFFSILVGAGIGKLIDLSKQNRVGGGIIAVSAMLLLTMNVVAVQNKAELMKANGERAALLLSRIIPYVEQIHKDGQLLLLNPTPDGVEYSVFLMNGFSVLQNGLNRIRQLSGRVDLRVEIIPQFKIELNQLPHDALILALDRETGDIIRIQ